MATEIVAASLFNSCILFLSCRLYYFSLYDDFPPLLYTLRSIYIGVLPYLINYNAKQCNKSKKLTMDHELVNWYSCCLHTGEYHDLFEGLRQIYYTDLELNAVLWL